MQTALRIIHFSQKTCGQVHRTGSVFHGKILSPGCKALRRNRQRVLSCRQPLKTHPAVVKAVSPKSNRSHGRLILSILQLHAKFHGTLQNHGCADGHIHLPCLSGGQPLLQAVFPAAALPFPRLFLLFLRRRAAVFGGIRRQAAAYSQNSRQQKCQYPLHTLSSLYL